MYVCICYAYETQRAWEECAKFNFLQSHSQATEIPRSNSPYLSSTHPEQLLHTLACIRKEGQIDFAEMEKVDVPRRVENSQASAE